MIKAWRVRLEIGRDDGGVLDDEVLEALSTALAGMPVAPAVSRGDDAAIEVELSVQARTDRDAMMAGERELRTAVVHVWSTRTLPPFTISSVEATERSSSPDVV